MSTPLFIYIHGFNSSPDSFKAKLLVRWLGDQGRGDEVLVPALSHWPAQAIATLEALVERHPNRNIILLGSSLGGFYATYLVEKRGLNAVLINPAVRPFELLKPLLGENQNLYTGEQYLLTEEHLRQLQGLDCEQFTDLNRYLLMVQTADEVLDYRQAVDLYRGAEMIIQPGGSHGFDNFEDMLEQIDQFSRSRPRGSGTIEAAP